MGFKLITEIAPLTGVETNHNVHHVYSLVPQVLCEESGGGMGLGMGILVPGALRPGGKGFAIEWDGTRGLGKGG